MAEWVIFAIYGESFSPGRLTVITECVFFLL